MHSSANVKGNKAGFAPTTVSGAQPLLQVVRGVYAILPTTFRTRAGGLVLGMLAVSGLEIVSLLFIAFYAALLSNPEAAEDSKAFAALSAHLPWLLSGDAGRRLIVVGLAAALGLAARSGAKTALDYATNRYTATVGSLIGSRLLRGFGALPYSWHIRQNSSDLTNLFLWRTHVGNVLVNRSLQIASATLQAIFLLAAMISAQPLATVVVLLFLGGTGAILFRFMQPRIDGNAQSLKENLRGLLRQVTQFIHGIKEIKLCGRRSLVRRFERDLDEAAFLQARQNLYTELPSSMLEVLGFFSIIMLVAIIAISSGEPATRLAGSVVFIALAAYRLQPAVINILNYGSAIRSSLPMVSAVLRVLEEFEAHMRGRPSASAAGNGPAFDHEIEVRGLGFSYDPAGREALSGIDFSIRRGEVLGIVGFSGAGKSTLVDILVGLLRESRGEILVDGTPLGPDEREGWMRRFGYVSQSPYLVDDTLAANVALAGDGEADRNRIEECCRLAHVNDFLGELENGMDTAIGERGSRLSGGQIQRVAIARALYASPEIVVFDEATSALDARSETIIQETILGLRGKVTVILIAHRLGSIRCADRLLWLEKGRMRMSGETETVLERYKEASAGREDAGERIMP